jgi:hypothetical protein
MKTLFLLLLCGPGRAFFGSDAPKTAVLWVPPESFSDWQDLDGVLGRHGELKLTIAVSPSMLERGAKKALAPWLANGRVEAALRLDGDPILPLVAGNAKAPRPDDVPTRLALARERWKAELSTAPAGFVPGAGALSADLLGSLRAVTLQWAATGEYSGSTASWAGSAGTLLVPMRAPRTEGRELSASDLGLDDPGQRVVFAVDEADGLVPLGSLLRLLESPAGGKAKGWATVSEAAKAWGESARPAAKVADWPAWTGLGSWTDGPRAARAWSLYAEASQTLDRYQNSGSADLKALELASLELYAAQANRFYRELPPHEAEQAAKEHRSRLLAVFRKLKQTPPDALFKAGTTAAADEQPTGVRVSEGPDWLQFDNPSGTFGRAPPGFQLEGGGPPGAAFKLERLRVESGGAGVSFVLKLGKLDTGAALQPPASAAPDLGRVLLEVYVDVNHVQGAGASTLLFDRSTFVVGRDAWEYALTISAWGAYLYKANPLGTPLQLSRLAVLADPSTREVRVTIPRSQLPGNALRWGYVATAALADAATAAKPPVKPAKPQEGSAILGVLAPLEQQKALADAKTAKPRLAAVRAN